MIQYHNTSIGYWITNTKCHRLVVCVQRKSCHHKMNWKVFLSSQRQFTSMMLTTSSKGRILISSCTLFIHTQVVGLWHCLDNSTTQYLDSSNLINHAIPPTVVWLKHHGTCEQNAKQKNDAKTPWISINIGKWNMEWNSRVPIFILCYI
jgi:hypothetical protein